MKNMLWLLLLASSCFGIAGDYNADGIVNLQDYSMAANGGWNQRVVTVMENWLMADKYVQFDGIAGRVTVPSSEALNPGTGDFTICFWVKRETSASYPQTILDKYQFLNDIGPEIILNSNGTVSLIATGTTDSPTITTIALDASTFYFVVFSYDASGVCIPYVNGIAGTGVNVSAVGNISSLEDLTIGAKLTGTTYNKFFIGSIDDLRIYKAALTAGEIAEIYNGGVGKKYAALSTGRTAAAAFNFDEGVGNYTLDAVGGLLGTKTSGVTWVSGGVPFPNSTIVDAVDVADALVTALNTNQGAFTTPFTAVRNLLPIHTIDDLASLKVTVLPASLEETVFSRAACQDDFVIHIGVQQRIAKDTDIETALPTLIGLVTEIKDFLKMKNLTSVGACWVSTKIDPIYSREHLQQDKVFTSLLIVTYRVLA